MAKAQHAPRNHLIAPSVYRYSRSQVYAKRALWKRKKTTTPKTAKQAVDLAATKTVEIKGEKNGSTRTVALHKAPRWYPAEDVSHPLRNRKHKDHPTRLRASITPGTVLILLAGRFRGKRVVFLKQLTSGLLLVTGPYKVNGVPLRRVSQAYVIATSTKVDIAQVKIDDSVNDDYFKRAKEPKKKKTEEEFFGEKSKTPLPESKIGVQKAVDAAIVAAINKEAFLKSYMNASFSLSKGQAPHAIKF